MHLSVVTHVAYETFDAALSFKLLDARFDVVFKIEALLRRVVNSDERCNDRVHKEVQF